MCEILLECTDELNEAIEALIFNKCTASLGKLDLGCMTTERFEAISEPSTNYQLFVVRSAKNCLMLNAWFPNLASLELLNVEMVGPMRIEQLFPPLNELMVHNDKKTLPKSAIIGMMRMNPQLRKMGWIEVEYG